MNQSVNQDPHNFEYVHAYKCNIKTQERVCPTRGFLGLERMHTKVFEALKHVLADTDISKSPEQNLTREGCDEWHEVQQVASPVARINSGYSTV